MQYFLSKVNSTTFHARYSKALDGDAEAVDLALVA